MNTSLSWVKAYVPELDVTAQEYTDSRVSSSSRKEPSKWQSPSGK